MAEALRRHRHAQPRQEKKLSETASRCLEMEVQRAFGGASIVRRYADSIAREVKASVAASTANSYAPKWTQFTEWCLEHGECPLPASEESVAAFLACACDKDRTVGPTKKRSAAISFFHTSNNRPSPCEGEFVSRVRKGISRRLGRTGGKMEAVTQENVVAVLRLAKRSGHAPNRLVADASAVMHEAQLRFDDAVSVSVGDIVWEKHFLRILVVGTKTDADKDSQWGFLAASEHRWSGYQRLLALIRRGIARFGGLPERVRRSLTKGLMQDMKRPFLQSGESAIETIPDEISAAASKVGLTPEVLENLPLLGTWLGDDLDASGNLRSTMKYRQFLGTLKALFTKAAGHRAEDIGTHSLRRGGTTAKIAAGIDTRLVKFLGRWRSDKAFSGYIDAGVTAQLCAEAVERSRSAPPRR